MSLFKLSLLCRSNLKLVSETCALGGHRWSSRAAVEVLPLKYSTGSGVVDSKKRILRKERLKHKPQQNKTINDKTATSTSIGSNSELVESSLSESSEKSFSQHVTKEIQTTSTIWSNLRNSGLKAAVIITQGDDLLRSKLLTEPNRNLLKDCLTFLKKAFPLWQQEVATHARLLTACIRTDNPRLELHSYLKNVEKLNMDYATFVDVLLASGEPQKAKHFVNRRRAESRTVAGLQSGVFVRSSIIYERLANWMAKKTDYIGLGKLLGSIEEDGLRPSLQTYLSCLESLGRMKQAEEAEITKILGRIESDGYDLRSSMMNSFYEKDDLKYILTAILTVDPNFKPDLTLKGTDPIRRPAMGQVESVPLAGVNPYGGVLTQEEIEKNYQSQMEIEQAGGLSIKPVAQLEEIKDTEKRKAMRGLLMQERDIWRHNLSVAFDEMMRRLQHPHDQGKLTAYPFLKLLPKENYIEMMIAEVDNIIAETAFQFVSSGIVYVRLGETLNNAFSVKRKTAYGVLDQVNDVYKNYLTECNSPTLEKESYREMWMSALQSRLQGPSVHQNWPAWSMGIKVKVGKKLYELIYEQLKFNIKALSSSKQAREETPAIFEVLSEYPGEIRNEIKVHPSLINWYRAVGFLPLKFRPTELPTLCPPIPWVDTSDAGYFLSSSYATRLIRQALPTQTDDLDFDPKLINPIYDALNVLGACPWKVNNKMLDNVLGVFRHKGDRKLDIAVPDTECPLPPKITKQMTWNEKYKTLREIGEIKKQKAEMRSLWASELYRLSIANKFRDKVFWFPHSMDFRGRVYPCPPHFNHMGSDVSRSIMIFASSKPIGEKGLDWLKIHLINLTGLKKRSSNQERLEYANQIIDDIVDSADRPFNGRGWWKNEEAPWQTLSCCMELARALRWEGGPAGCPSSLPVHQDGSCNGLQHYAALGRDRRGAESVNLTDLPIPQDVYGDVVQLVEEQRKKDAEDGSEVAQILEGFVRRKVIKQSVMTTVYGVTLYGAREQIRRQLRDLDDFPKEWVGKSAAYLAKMTLGSIGKIFTSSTEIQGWFAQMAHRIASQRGCRVRWETPLGLTAIQPYISDKRSLTGASTSRGTLLTNEPNTIKQKNAFPPNYIHSLDSTHMMLTALHCFRAGITFACVHDCFWTHAGTVDLMNEICREEFVALHSQPLLDNLSDYLFTKFSYSQREMEEMKSEELKQRAISFNKLIRTVPTRGDYDLGEVLKSTYFFS